MLKKINNPILFQGNLNKNNYFEGWYFKNVNLESNNVISFIPGISLNKEDPHSFIQVIISKPISTYYIKYNLEDFTYGDDPFYVKIGNSYFSKEELIMDISHKDLKISGKLKYNNFSHLEKNILMPNIMGFFAYLPNMACNHGVISMNHWVNGHLSINEKELVFTDDKSYIEKDWGRTFPNKYIWIQANNFENPLDSFMISIANIPMPGFSFTGLIANLVLDSKEYRFATYNGGKIKDIKASKGEVNIIVKKGDLTLEVTGLVKDSGDLKAPINGKMIEVIKEGLGGEVEVTLKKKDTIIGKINSKYGGIEVVNYWLKHIRKGRD